MIIRIRPFDGDITTEEIEHYLNSFSIVQSDINHHAKLYAVKVFCDILDKVKIEDEIKIDMSIFTFTEFKIILGYIGNIRIKENKVLMKNRTLDCIKNRTDLISRLRFISIAGYFMITKSDYCSYGRLNERRCLLKSDRGDLEFNCRDNHFDHEMNNFQIILEYSELIYYLLFINSWRLHLNNDILSYLKFLLYKGVNLRRFARIKVM